MTKKILFLFSTFLSLAYAGPEQAPMSVWVNEAIVATYSYNATNFLENQQHIAKYFTSEGWIAYTKAQNDAKIPDEVKKNQYQVSAVATEPPVITAVDATHWQATMPVLVVYQNPQFQQRQHVKVTLGFNTAPEGQGVRGYSINSFQAVNTQPKCQCAM